MTGLVGASTLPTTCKSGNIRGPRRRRKLFPLPAFPMSPSPSIQLDHWQSIDAKGSKEEGYCTLTAPGTVGDNFRHGLRHSPTGGLRTLRSAPPIVGHGKRPVQMVEYLSIHDSRRDCLPLTLLCKAIGRVQRTSGQIT